MKKIWQWVIIIPILAGVVIGVYISVNKQVQISNDNSKIENVFGIASSKTAKITSFYSFGTSLNIEGTIEGISKDNFEGIKIVVTDGEDYNKNYSVQMSFEDGNLYFSTEKINNAIDLESLGVGEYYILIRLKLNNNKDYKYYLLENTSTYEDIEYYTLTKDEQNRKIDIKFGSLEYNETQMPYLGLTVTEAELPEDVYDFVIDPGHGGISDGETYNEYKESSLMLEYAESLKSSLEAKGYKVKLTRDASNSDSFTTDEYAANGRIGVACSTKAKYMISLHLNGTSQSNSGFEIYTPNDCDLKLAGQMATNMFNTGIGYSTYDMYKVADGIYTKNYNNYMIEEAAKAANNNGYDAYNITTSTPYLYTIREVGGIATNAYMDGRNTYYSANAYYDSNQGIECYQIFIGYINNDLDYILSSQDIFAEAIADCF